MLKKMFVKELAMLDSIAKDKCSHNWITDNRDIPGFYIGLIVRSLEWRGLVKWTWQGGFGPTKNGRARLIDAS
jgi:hypothetical protein